MKEPLHVTLRQMETFCTVARLQSFSAAARQTGISQPSLSAAVRKLETTLGMELFHRTTRRVELTEAGLLLYRRAAGCLATLEDLVVELQSLAAQRSGTVEIAAPPLLATAMLPRAVADFTRRLPGIRVRVFDTGTDQIIDMVRSGRASLGIGTFPEALPELSATVVMRDEAMLFCHRDHPLAARAQVGWAEIVDDPQITLGPNSSLRTLAERGFAEVGRQLHPAYEVNQVATVLALVRQNVGVAVLPAYARSLAGEEGPLVGVGLTGPVIVRNISLLHASGRRLSPAAQTFAEVIRSIIHLGDGRPSEDPAPARPPRPGRPPGA